MRPAARSANKEKAILIGGLTLAGGTSAEVADSSLTLLDGMQKHHQWANEVHLSAGRITANLARDARFVN